MKKIFTLRPNESWICDTIAQQFDQFIDERSTNNPYEADIIWCLSDWCWDQLPYDLLSKKKVVTTCHHYVPEKFTLSEQNNFKCRDAITDIYHVYNERTLQFIRQFTNKPIKLLPYWVDTTFWNRNNTKQTLRKQLNLSQDTFIVMSAQRDTEGSGISQGIYLPKYEKGPDVFCDYVEYLNSQRQNLLILLGGWRRQYVINRLQQKNIKNVYIERSSLETIKNMYIASDLYVVGSRHEGGPQAILEAAALRTPIISTPVGVAEQILHKDNINVDLQKCLYGFDQHVEYAYNNIKTKFDKNIVIPQYVDFFEQL